MAKRVSNLKGFNKLRGKMISPNERWAVVARSGNGRGDEAGGKINLIMIQFKGENITLRWPAVWGLPQRRRRREESGWSVERGLLNESACCDAIIASWWENFDLSIDDGCKTVSVGQSGGAWEYPTITHPSRNTINLLTIAPFPLLAILISADWTARKRLTRVCRDVIERPAR